MKKLSLLISLLLVSQIATADKIESIRIFHADDNLVKQDLKLPRGIIYIFHNMSDSDRIKAELNDRVKKIVPKYKSLEPIDAYSQAFSDFMNSGQWPSIHRQFTHSARGIEQAIRYQVKKVPAVVFNGSQVIYGVSSLNEAINIFQEKNK